ncbi:MAG TPA: chain length determinant protein EpsF [Burkholderiales bacterium]|nr:chain length determinant protein EpsF [Burkholderiales bacterium]
MSFTQLLLVFRARWKTAVGSLLIVLLLALALSVELPKKYTATATVVVDFKGTDPILGIVLPAQMVPGYMATQVDIVQSHKVAVDVVRALKLTNDPTVRQKWEEETGGAGTPDDWLADLIAKKLDVKPSRESSVIDIAWTGVNPQDAAAVANAYADAYIKTNLELRVDPARQSASFFDEQLKALREKLEQAQTRLNQYQRRKEFTTTDERLDLDNARLAELSGQYTAAQAQAADASSRQRQLREFLARGANPDSLPDVLANPLIQNLKASLAASEAKLEQVSSQLGANHPEVLRLKADIEQQGIRLKAEIATAANAIDNTARIADRRATELREAVAEQKARVLRLSEGRDEMAVLLKEVDSAQKAYDAASQRFTQTSFESQTSQTNISILNRAIAPLEPSFPKPILNCALGLVFGTLLGLGLALLREVLDKRVRSLEDLVTGFDFPVLAALDKGRVQKRRRWPWRRRASDGLRAAG